MARTRSRGPSELRSSRFRQDKPYRSLRNGSFGAPGVHTPRSSGVGSFLDASSAFEGEIRSSEPLRLEGRVKGEIHCEHSIVISESARIDATIRAAAVAIAGEVRGQVHAARKITLAATARMVGDLTTPAIVIEEGAELAGRIQIGAQHPTSERQPEKAEQAVRPRPVTPSATPPPSTA